MTKLQISAAAAGLAGAVLTAIPVVRAVMYLRQKTGAGIPETNGKNNRFAKFRKRLDEKIAGWASEVPGWVTKVLLVGLTLLIYSAAIDFLYTAGLIGVPTNG